MEEEVGSSAQVLVAVEAMTPPSLLPPGGFLGDGESTWARQPWSQVGRPKGCRDPHLPWRDGGWPPPLATCTDLGLLLAPGPTTKPWPGNNGDQLSRNDGAVASNSQKGHYVTL